MQMKYSLEEFVTNFSLYIYTFNRPLIGHKYFPRGIENVSKNRSNNANDRKS